MRPTRVSEKLKRLIFVRKRWTGSVGWSDALGQFYQSAAAEFSTSLYVEIAVRPVRELRSANSNLLAMAGKGEATDLIILVNHSICWWALSPALLMLKRRGATICLCMHEHEHILGMLFVLRNALSFRPKEALRYSRLFHAIPAKLSTRVLVLAEAQAAAVGVPNAIRTSYLPVSGKQFPPQQGRPAELKRVTVLFAHEPSRFDKGHRFLTAAERLTDRRLQYVYGRDRDLPPDQVYTKYWGCDILFLPSDWESYSLVFVEALACNKLIVSSNRIGALRLLLSKYSLDQLEMFGVFISDHVAACYARTLDRAAARVEQGRAPTTRALFDEFSFNVCRFPLSLI